MVKTYKELSRLLSFDERQDYLKLNGRVGSETFGIYRYLNQMFYTSDEWKNIRSYIIARDEGCDLGIKELPIQGSIIIHHINPITMDDIMDGNDCILDPENLVCVSDGTHRFIHYGFVSNIPKFIERRPGDTCPWKQHD